MSEDYLQCPNCGLSFHSRGLPNHQRHCNKKERVPRYSLSMLASFSGVNKDPDAEELVQQSNNQDNGNEAGEGSTAGQNDTTTKEHNNEDDDNMDLDMYDDDVDDVGDDSGSGEVMPAPRYDKAIEEEEDNNDEENVHAPSFISDALLVAQEDYDDTGEPNTFSEIIVDPNNVPPLTTIFTNDDQDFAIDDPRDDDYLHGPDDNPVDEEESLGLETNISDIPAASRFQNTNQTNAVPDADVELPPFSGRNKWQVFSNQH